MMEMRTAKRTPNDSMHIRILHTVFPPRRTGGKCVSAATWRKVCTHGMPFLGRLFKTTDLTWQIRALPRNNGTVATIAPEREKPYQLPKQRIDEKNASARNYQCRS